MRRSFLVKPITAGLYRTKDLTVIISMPHIFHKQLSVSFTFVITLKSQFLSRMNVTCLVTCTAVVRETATKVSEASITCLQKTSISQEREMKATCIANGQEPGCERRSTRWWTLNEPKEEKKRQKSIKGVLANGDDSLDRPSLRFLSCLSYIYTFLFRRVYFSALNTVSKGVLPNFGICLLNYTA